MTQATARRLSPSDRVAEPMRRRRAGATMGSVNPRLSTASQGGPVNTNIHTNIAARMGRWSASHRKVAIFGWFAFVIAAIAIGTAVGQKSIERGHADEVPRHRPGAELHPAPGCDV
jgi:hypothetical protein